MPNTPLSPFVDHPTVLKVDDRQRLARERREEREKQLGKAHSEAGWFVCFSWTVICMQCYGQFTFRGSQQNDSARYAIVSF